MKISQQGIDLIKRFEGLELRAYKCPAGVWTIGYGHTQGVKPGDLITPEQAEAMLKTDLVSREKAVAALCPKTTQGQFDALVSFVYNLGERSLETSTLRKLHNAGKYAEAEQQFRRWVNAGGKKLAGLVKRRYKEAELYRS